MPRNERRCALTITPLTFIGDDAALLRALRAGHPGAAARFYDQHAAHVHRTLSIALGPDTDVRELLQEVFIRALERSSGLRELGRARSWLTSLAVGVARTHLRHRSRQTRLRLFAPKRPRPRRLAGGSLEAGQALREIYDVLAEMPVDERMAFVLRLVGDSTLSEAAEACQTSLATLKRRLLRAERRFLDAARGRPLLDGWLEKGERWSVQRQR